MNQPDNTEGGLATACDWRIPEKPYPNTQPPAAGPQTPAPAVKVAAKRATRRIQFPIGVRINITPAMAASLGRIRRRMRLPEGVICRLALMAYLAGQDREYREDD
jgi:hypothetical protein